MQKPLSVLRLSALLGLAAGCLEVGLRATPRLGLSTGELLAWVGISALLSLGYVLAAAGVLLSLARVSKRLPVMGLVAGSLLWIHGALFYRFEIFLNEFIKDPRVWGGLLLISLGCLLAGWLLDRPLRTLGTQLELACVALILVGFVGAVVRGQPPALPDQQGLSGPNVLLITLDTVRHDALEPYGGPVATPTISRLAAEGVVFEQAVSTAPLTESSHLAMLTGLAPPTSGIVSNGTNLGQQPALLSHAFSQAGYATGGFVAAFPLHGKYGWPQGFQVYDDDFGAMPGLHRLSLVKAWDQVTLPAHALRERRGDAVLDRALHWLERVEQGRWFMWLHLFDPHGPYEAPAPFHPQRAAPTDGERLELPYYWPPAHLAITDPQWLIDAYHGEVRYADHLLGTLIEELASKGLLDDTALLLTGDHGESLVEHDYLFDHGDHLYDASLRVPLLMRLPARIPAGQRIPCQVSTVDVAPTLLDLAGVDDGQQRDGASLAAVAAGLQPCQERDALSTTVVGRFVAEPPVDHSLRARGRKFIQHQQAEDELYDLGADPGETRNLAASRADEAAALEAVLESRLGGELELKGPSTDAQTVEALRALGYVE